MKYYETQVWRDVERCEQELPFSINEIAHRLQSIIDSGIEFKPGSCLLSAFAWHTDINGSEFWNDLNDYI